MFDGAELRGLLFGTDPAAAAKLNPWQRLVVSLGQLSQLLRNIAALRVLSKIWMPLGKRIVLLGGGLVGLELAEYLSERGRHVTVLEPSANLGAELSIVRRARIIHELREHGVVMHRNVEIKEITRTSVLFAIDGAAQEVAVDQVIIAMGAKPNTHLFDAIRGAGIQAIAVGDCHSVGYIEGAILSGRQAALSLTASNQQQYKEVAA